MDQEDINDLVARGNAAMGRHTPRMERQIKNVMTALIRASRELDAGHRLPLMGDEFWYGLARAAMAAALTELATELKGQTEPAIQQQMPVGMEQAIISEAVRAAVAAEREACAKIADEGAHYGTAEGAEDMAKTIGRLIRERSQPASEQ